MQHIYYDYLFHIKNVKTPTVLIIKILIHIKFIPTLFIYIMTITCSFSRIFFVSRFYHQIKYSNIFSTSDRPSEKIM